MSTSISATATPTSATPSATTTASGGGSGPSSPLLFFVALGFGVVFTNLWIIVGVKYCFRYNQRNRARMAGEDPDAVDMANMPQRRRRREKKLMSMEEVNEKFPLTKYKTWRSNQAEQGLPTAGGITADAGAVASRPASIRGVSRGTEDTTDATKHTELATTQTVSTTATTEKQEPAHGKPEELPTSEAQPSSPRPTTATSSHNPPDTPTIAKVTSNEDEELDDHIQTAVPAEQLPDPGDTCAICIDTLEDDDDVRGLLCGHAFHASCVDPWLTSRRACCPLCKADYYVPKPRPEGQEGQTPTTPQVAFMGDGRGRRPTMVLPGRFMSIVYDERDRYGFPRVMREETPAERRRRERREQRIRDRNGEAAPANPTADGAAAGTGEQPQEQQQRRGGWNWQWRPRVRMPGLRLNRGGATGTTASETNQEHGAPEIISDGARDPVTPAQLEAGQQGAQQTSTTRT